MVFKSMGSTIVSGGEDVIWRYSIVTLYVTLSPRSAIDLEKTKICHRFDLFDVCNEFTAIGQIVLCVFYLKVQHIFVHNQRCSEFEPDCIALGLFLVGGALQQIFHFSHVIQSEIV